jgi:hypothetical protein
MAVPRSLVVDSEVPGYYNCTSRCVRGAFLCGNAYEHRREWILDRLILLDDSFAIEVCAYAILGNHLHTMLYADHHRSRAWPAREVVRRWLTVCPKSVPEDLEFEEVIEELARDAELVATWRFRLSSVSWFMKCLKEPIARLANREDGCTGAFWEGRFNCQHILDKAGRLSCSLYIDLNLIRAAMAQTPEGSDFSSVQDRIAVRQEFERLKAARKRGLPLSACLDEAKGAMPHAACGATARCVRRERDNGKTTADKSRRPATRLVRPEVDAFRHPEDAIWLKPIEHRDGAVRGGMLDITLEHYLELVDTMGRMLRTGKRGVIPDRLAPILERLEIELETWLENLLRDTTRIMGTAIGLTRSLTAEALRRGQWRVRTSLHLDG